MKLFVKNNKSLTDPVCGMIVKSNTMEISAVSHGETYYFCSENCRKAFMESPKKYLCLAITKKKKGVWGRYLARLEKVSGGKAMKCH